MKKIEIFVFGSNLSGNHGRGAAKYAVQAYGARHGQAIGRQGNAYAIPIKDAKFKALPLDRIKRHVDDFLNYAHRNPGLTFLVTAVGTGLAGCRPSDIAPFFGGAPPNCLLPKEFRPHA